MAEQIKKYVDYLISNNITEADALEMIKQCSKLSPDEKNLIYAYTFPRPLRDKELPSRVQNFRSVKGLPMKGMLTPSTPEATLIVEAARTGQYGKFIKHLIHAFSDPSKVSPLEGDEATDCPICGKHIYEKNMWDYLIERDPTNPEKDNREFLAFGSTESSITLCVDCLIQLIHASTLLEEIDPEFLSWDRNNTNKSTWEDLKL